MAGMGEIFDLAVVIEAIDKFSGPLKAMESSMASAEVRMKAISKTMKNMGTSASDIKKVEESLKGLQIEDNFAKMASDLERIGRSSTEIDALRQSYTRLAEQQQRVEDLHGKMMKWGKVALTGAAITGAGAIGANLLVKSLEKAGEFQTKMTVIQDITGATNSQMNNLGNSIMNVSTKVSKFNDMTLAGFAQQLASGGFSNVKQVQGLMLPVSQYAEAQFYEGKQSDPTEAVKQAIEMAHVFKNYNPKSFTNFLDTFNKYSNMQPGDSTSLFNTLNYLAPVASREFKMNTNDVMSLAAIANRVGLTGTHGGTNAADMILRLIPGLIGGTTPKITYAGTGKNKHIVSETYPQALQAMMDLGLADSKGNSKFFKNGHITNVRDMLGTLINASKKLTPEQLVTDYKKIFGIHGGRAAAILSDKSTVEQMQQMQKQLGKTKSMSQIQKDISKTPQGQLDLLKSNAMTANLRFAQALGPLLNPIITNLNKMLGSFLKIEQQHPKLMKYVGLFAVMATALLLFSGPLTSAIGLIMMMKNGIMLLANSEKLAAAASKIWSGVQLVLNAVMDANPISLIIVGIAALIAIIIIVVTHFKTVTNWVQNFWHWLLHLKDGVLIAIAAFMPFIGLPILIIKHWQQIKTWFGGLVKDMKSIGHNIVEGLANGILGAGAWFQNKIGSFVKKFVTGPFRYLLKINSPSKVFAEHGMYIVQGLAQGIDNNGKTAEDSVKGLARRTMDGMSGIRGTSTGSANNQPIVIQVYGGPNHDEEAIADKVVKKLGRVSKRMTMNSGVRLNIQSMG